MIGIYITSHTGTVHLTDVKSWLLSLEGNADKTLCGKTVQPDWNLGDETASGLVTTCISCKTRFDRFAQQERAEGDSRMRRRLRRGQVLSVLEDESLHSSPHPDVQTS